MKNILTALTLLSGLALSAPHAEASCKKKKHSSSHTRYIYVQQPSYDTSYDSRPSCHTYSAPREYYPTHQQVYYSEPTTYYSERPTYYSAPTYRAPIREYYPAPSRCHESRSFFSVVFGR